MKTKAFTLIELIAVITIIAIMAGIVVYSINDWKDDANLKKVIGYANEIKSKFGQDLLAEWKMEEGSGTILYDSGRLGAEATVYAGTNWSTDCAEGKSCFNFSNTMIAANVKLSQFKFKTICFWLKTAQANTYILGKRCGTAESSGDFDVFLTGGLPAIKSFTGENASVQATAIGTAVNDNNWHFLCLSLNENAEMYFIVDGQTRNFQTLTLNQLSGSNNLIYIGINQDTGAYGSFYMDDLMLFEKSIY